MRIATGLSIATVLAATAFSPMSFGDRFKPMTASLETPPAGLGRTAPELGAGRDAAPVATPAETSGNPLLAIPIAALAATREKPLFSITRRPPPTVVAAAPAEPPPAAPPPPPPAPERPALTLIGTIEGPLRPIALFRNDASSEVISAPLGAIAGGWKVIAVARRSATLVKGDKTVALDIPRLEAPPSAAATAPARAVR